MRSHRPPAQRDAGPVGMVEYTPSSQGPAPAPGATSETARLWVENGAGRPSGPLAPTPRPGLQPPASPPRAAAGYSSGLPSSGELPADATTSTSWLAA